MEDTRRFVAGARDMYSPNIPPLEDIHVASDLAQEKGADAGAAFLGLAPITDDDIEDWLDDLTLAEVLGSEEAADVDWNGEEESTNDGRAIVIRDSSGFEEKVTSIVEAMSERVFGKTLDDIGDKILGTYRSVDALIYSRAGTWPDGTKLEVWSSDDTDICCECHENLIHTDPYSGRDTSVFIDGEGFMCSDCCSADPCQALYRAALEPRLSTLEVEDIVALEEREQLTEAGWHQVVVCDMEVKQIEAKHEAVVSYDAPRWIGSTLTDLDREYFPFWSRYAEQAPNRAKVVWFNKRRLRDLR